MAMVNVAGQDEPANFQDRPDTLGVAADPYSSMESMIQQNGGVQYQPGMDYNGMAFARPFMGSPGTSAFGQPGGPQAGWWMLPKGKYDELFPQTQGASDNPFSDFVGGFKDQVMPDMLNPEMLKFMASVAGGVAGGPGTRAADFGSFDPGGNLFAQSGNFGGFSMPPAVLDTGGAAMMPAAIPEGTLSSMPAFPGFSGGGSPTMDPSLFSDNLGGFSVGDGTDLGSSMLDKDGFVGGASSGADPLSSFAEGGGKFSDFSSPMGYMPGESGGMPGSVEELLKKLGLRKPGGGPLSMGMSALSVLMGLNRSGQMDKLSAAAMRPPETRTIDPMTVGDRAGYAQQLKDLMANPDSVANLPGYKAGLDAVTRKMAAAGYLGSGNMATALLDYGGNAYNNQVKTLTELSGAQMPLTTIASNPGAAISAGASANDMLSKALASGGFLSRGLDDMIFGSK